MSFTVRHLMARVRGSFASFGGTIRGESCPVTLDLVLPGVADDP